METATLSTHQKALSINLDHKVYGTLAEIGAAQEVARWLFRVGGAAGKVGPLGHVAVLAARELVPGLRVGAAQPLRVRALFVEVGATDFNHAQDPNGTNCPVC